MGLLITGLSLLVLNQNAEPPNTYNWVFEIHDKAIFGKKLYSDLMDIWVAECKLGRI